MGAEDRFQSQRVKWAYRITLIAIGLFVGWLTWAQQRQDRDAAAKATKQEITDTKQNFSAVEGQLNQISKALHVFPVAQTKPKSNPPQWVINLIPESSLVKISEIHGASVDLWLKGPEHPFRIRDLRFTQNTVFVHCVGGVYPMWYLEGGRALIGGNRFLFQRSCPAGFGAGGNTSVVILSANLFEKDN